MKKRKIIIYLIFIIGIILLISLNKKGIKRSDINIDSIQRIVEASGVAGILVYILLNIIRPFVLVPTTIFFVAGGMIFGFVKGGIYTFIGIIISSTLSYKVSKAFRKEFGRVLDFLNLSKYIDKIKDIEKNKMIRGLFLMRITPGFPFDPISFGSGIANVEYKSFIMGTIFGVLPKLLIYSLIGAYLENIM